MMLEILTTTAAGLLVLAWALRRSTRAPVAARRSGPVRPQNERSCGPTAMLMAAPPDTATGTQPPKPAAAPGRTPPTRQPSGPTRRQFLRWSMGLGWLGVITGFAGASLAFLWPNLRGGFGAQIPAGTRDSILEGIDANEGRFEFPEARALIVRYDASQDPDGQYADLTNDTGIMALYQKCVHLGCKVPWCAASQWWECPCHGSKYNRWGEWQEGPAPRGLDRFAVQEVDGQIVIDTSSVITGPSRASAVLNQPPEGPHCTNAA